MTRITSKLRVKAYMLLAPLLLAAAMSASGGPVKEAPRHFYAVIFGVTLNEKGDLRALRVVKVLEPVSGSKEAVRIKIPKAFIESARNIIKAKKLEPEIKNGKPEEFFTYFYYDPSQPSRADFDPRKEE